MPSGRLAPALLVDALPAFAAELRETLVRSRLRKLVACIDDLPIVDRCRCGDDFCATFYAVPRPRTGWGKAKRTEMLQADKGMIIVDYEDRRILCVEVLFRDDVRKRLNTVMAPARKRKVARTFPGRSTRGQHGRERISKRT